MSTPDLLTNAPTYNGSSISMASNNTNTDFLGTTLFSACAWVDQKFFSGNSHIVGSMDSAQSFRGWGLFNAAASGHN